MPPTKNKAIVLKGFNRRRRIKGAHAEVRHDDTSASAIIALFVTPAIGVITDCFDGAAARLLAQP
jgi:phosphatidylglycerophosphate synthase